MHSGPGRGPWHPNTTCNGHAPDVEQQRGRSGAQNLLTLTGSVSGGGGGDSRVSRLVPMESGTALKAICMEPLFITEIRAVGQ